MGPGSESTTVVAHLCGVGVTEYGVHRLGAQEAAAVWARGVAAKLQMVVQVGVL